jgi:hypothetical protein
LENACRVRLRVPSGPGGPRRRRELFQVHPGMKLLVIHGSHARMYRHVSQPAQVRSFEYGIFVREESIGKHGELWAFATRLLVSTILNAGHFFRALEPIRLREGN